MSDWQVGDLAVCVDDSPCRCGFCGAVPSGLSLGKTYTVQGIDLHKGDVYLIVDKAPTSAKRHQTFENYAPAGRFRKITPDKHEDCEPEFVELLKRSRVKA